MGSVSNYVILRVKVLFQHFQRQIRRNCSTTHQLNLLTLIRRRSWWGSPAFLPLSLQIIGQRGSGKKPQKAAGEPPPLPTYPQYRSRICLLRQTHWVFYTSQRAPLLAPLVIALKSLLFQDTLIFRISSTLQILCNV